MAQYELNININTITGETSATERDTMVEKPENPAEQTTKPENKNLSARAVAGGAVAVATLGANIYKQTVAVNSGDQNEVNKTNFIVDKGSKIAGIGLAFLANPALGLAALGATAFSEAMSFATNQIAFNRQVQDEQIAIGTYQDRRGIAFNRSGR